ncbi:hypothetical protein M23134_01741 [Microscilla marina ATCC 23134]|uniref:Uncharacterized protein n=1 Tax=Microscilla marina ATCC 23134 TaxID=313606 RepID=A1ZYW5_MICM2|nr:hypothetical protein M23134_01741 [Microscilla marina ATCC 23134]
MVLHNGRFKVFEMSPKFRADFEEIIKLNKVKLSANYIS